MDDGITPKKKQNQQVEPDNLQMWEIEMFRINMMNRIWVLWLENKRSWGFSREISLLVREETKTEWGKT